MKMRFEYDGFFYPNFDDDMDFKMKHNVAIEFDSDEASADMVIIAIAKLLIQAGYSREQVIKGLVEVTEQMQTDSNDELR